MDSTGVSINYENKNWKKNKRDSHYVCNFFIQIIHLLSTRILYYFYYHYCNIQWTEQYGMLQNIYFIFRTWMCNKFSFYCCLFFCHTFSVDAKKTHACDALFMLHILFFLLFTTYFAYLKQKKNSNKYISSNKTTPFVIITASKWLFYHCVCY